MTMDEKKMFEAGCFLPSWTEETELEAMPISQVYVRRNKDLQTLVGELDQIKEHIQDVQQRQWNLAKLLHFHQNDFVKE